MAKGDTFFLRTTVTSSGTSYVSSDIDISAYTNPSQGRCLVVDKAFMSYTTDAGGPIIPLDVASASSTGSKQMGAQATSEKQTGLVEMSDNSLFARTNLYVANQANGLLTFISETSSLNPAEFTSGFIIPTDNISCGVDTSHAWNGEITVGFMFEVHTEKLSLQRIQELLVSLTAN
jgi:hypothetical protein